MSRLALIPLLGFAASCRTEATPAPATRPMLVATSSRALSRPPPAVEPAAAPLPIPAAPRGFPKGRIGDYRSLLGTAATPDGDRVVVLRSFQRGETAHLLVVSPKTLATRVVERDSLRVEPASWEAIEQQLTGSAYLRARSDAAHHASAMQDAGITHLLPSEHGAVLTIDLCPSHRPFEEALIQRVIDTFTPEEHPVPLAIALTGVWMQQHPAELARLLERDLRGQLAITWINHSYNHRYDPRLPLPLNFLLEKGTRIEDEILRNEIAMLESGITPSVLFRFPGLISSPELVRTVVGYGLIPVGSDAWLAKRERAHAGGIVLVHGNGNEPEGVSAFFGLLAQEKRDILKRQFLLIDIRAGIEDEEEAH